jgi:hypothetical protein
MSGGHQEVLGPIADNLDPMIDASWSQHPANMA